MFRHQKDILKLTDLYQAKFTNNYQNNANLNWVFFQLFQSKFSRKKWNFSIILLYICPEDLNLKETIKVATVLKQMTPMIGAILSKIILFSF